MREQSKTVAEFGRETSEKRLEWARPAMRKIDAREAQNAFALVNDGLGGQS